MVFSELHVVEWMPGINGQSLLLLTKITTVLWRCKLTFGLELHFSSFSCCTTWLSNHATHYLNVQFLICFFTSFNVTWGVQW